MAHTSRMSSARPWLLAVLLALLATVAALPTHALTVEEDADALLNQVKEEIASLIEAHSAANATWGESLDLSLADDESEMMMSEAEAEAEAEEEASLMQTESTSHSTAEVMALALAQTATVPLCMSVVGLDPIDIPSMKKHGTNLKAQIQHLKEKLKTTTRKSRVARIKAQIKCLKQAKKIHAKGLAGIGKYQEKAKNADKEGDKAEVELLNLPCDLPKDDEGRPLKCDPLLCKVKGWRRRARNYRYMAQRTFRAHVLRLRLADYVKQIKHIKKTRSCPEARVTIVKGDAALMEVDAEAATNATAEADAEWQESWIICLDRTERSMKELEDRIERLTGKVKAGASKDIPLTCKDKRAGKIFPPKCKPPKQKRKPRRPKPRRPRRYKGKDKYKPFGFATASASGDPHTNTFDGIHHDTMVAGWFTWVENPVITIQCYTQLGCMPPSTPNTCIRACVVRIRPPRSDEQLVVSFGQWPPSRHVQNVLIHDQLGKKIRQVNVHPNKFRPGVYLGGKYHIHYRGGNLYIRPHGKFGRNPELATSVTIGVYSLAVTLPKSKPHVGHTNGMMGFFNGRRMNDYGKVFRFRNGRESRVDARALCQRCGWGARQSPPVLEWAATHVVHKTKNPPIGVGQKALKQQKYLNSHHRNKRYNGFLQLNATIGMHLEALAEAAMEFNPMPKANKALVVPSFVPKVSLPKLKYCRRIIKKALKKKVRKDKQKKKKEWWEGKKCLDAKQMKKAEVELKKRKAKIEISKKHFREQLNACLQDAAAKDVAKTVADQNKAERHQQKKNEKILKKEIKKKIIKKKVVINKKIVVHKKKIKEVKFKKDKEAERMAKEAEEENKKEREENKNNDNEQDHPPARRHRRRRCPRAGKDCLQPSVLHIHVTQEVPPPGKKAVLDRVEGQVDKLAA